MFQNSAFRQDALDMESIKDKTEDWKKTRNEKYIREAGWHFKTLAVQEVGAYIQNTMFHTQVGKTSKSFDFNLLLAQCTKIGKKLQFQKYKNTLFAFSKMAKNQFLHQKIVRKLHFW